MVGSETRSTKALGLIRAELSDLKKRRVSALALYLGLVLGFLGLLFFSPGKSPPKNIDVFWLSSLAVLFFSSAIAGAATIGLPLLRRNATYVLTAGAGLGLIGALALVAQWDASRLETGQGAHCFLYCAAVSSAAMVVLGILSGRLWRRFPNPGLILAIGVTGVGMAGLHIRCAARDPLHLFGFHLAPLAVLYVAARLFTKTREAVVRE